MIVKRKFYGRPFYGTKETGENFPVETYLEQRKQDILLQTKADCQAAQPIVQSWWHGLFGVQADPPTWEAYVREAHSTRFGTHDFGAYGY